MSIPTRLSYQIQNPVGQIIDIPSCVLPTEDPYANFPDLLSQKQYYEDNGYVVIRDLIPTLDCDAILEAFEKEVKEYKGYIYRQTSSFPEKHVLSDSGYILNSIKHIQDMNPKDFPSFRETSFKALTHPNVVQVVQNLIDDNSIIVQSMFFDGNPSTPPHYDSYYLDSAAKGKMVGIWVALEDIHPGAGRFYIYPKSHYLNLPNNEGSYEITEHHANFISAIKKIISEPEMECRAPALKKGDVLFWNSLTIHGSLQTSQPEFSRKSLTAHFIPASQDYVLFQKANINLNIKYFHDFPVHCPKDPDRLINRLQILGLKHFPDITNKLRKRIIRFRMK